MVSRSAGKQYEQNDNRSLAVYVAFQGGFQPVFQQFNRIPQKEGTYKTLVAVECSWYLPNDLPHSPNASPGARIVEYEKLVCVLMKD